MKEMNKFYKKHGMSSRVSKMEKVPISLGHASPRVLKAEKKLGDYAGNVYGHKGVQNMRLRTGETGVDKLSSGQIRRIEKFSTKQRAAAQKQLERRVKMVWAAKAPGYAQKVRKLKILLKLLSGKSLQKAVTAVKYIK